MKLTVNLNDFKKQFAKNRKLGDTVMDAAYDFFRKSTPIRSGNARRNTYITQNRSQIVADYPYAQRLDTGYSKQAPDGMSEPTLEFIEKEVNKFINNTNGSN